MEGTSEKEKKQQKSVDFESFKNQVLADYKLACLSREASLLGRKYSDELEHDSGTKSGIQSSLSVSSPPDP